MDTWQGHEYMAGTWIPGSDMSTWLGHEYMAGTWVPGWDNFLDNALGLNDGILGCGEG